MQDLTPQFNTAKLKAMILERAKRLEDAALLRLMQVFELALNYYRNSNTWTDQTGNLRSSGGVVILRNGVQVEEGGFETVLSGTEGSATGRNLAGSLAARYPVGLVGIMVAGMDYAIHVEAKGRDVLTGPSLIAKEALRKAIAELQAQAAKR